QAHDHLICIYPILPVTLQPKLPPPLPRSSAAPLFLPRSSAAGPPFHPACLSSLPPALPCTSTAAIADPCSNEPRRPLQLLKWSTAAAPPSSPRTSPVSWGPDLAGAGAVEDEEGGGRRLLVLVTFLLLLSSPGRSFPLLFLSSGWASATPWPPSAP